VRNRKRECSTPKIDIAKVPAQKLAAYPQKFATVIAGREAAPQVDEIWSFTAAKQRTSRSGRLMALATHAHGCALYRLVQLDQNAQGHRGACRRQC
jgi:hypothetical protein